MNAKELAEEFRTIAEHSIENLKLGLASEQLQDLIQDQHRELGRILHVNRKLLKLDPSRLPEYFPKVCGILNCEPKDIVATVQFINTKDWTGGRREVTSETKRVTHLVGYSRWFAKLLNQYAKLIEQPESVPGPFDYKNPFEFMRAKLETESVQAGKIESDKRTVAPKQRKRKSLPLTSDETKALRLHSQGKRPTEIDVLLKNGKCYVYGEHDPIGWYKGHTAKLLSRPQQKTKMPIDCES